MKAFFENPWMLLALLGAALPIIIEILFRRRKRQVQLPTIRYLLKSKEQEKVKKQDRLLLILRTILLALLALAISRPLIRQGVNSSGNDRNVVILFDGSASTNQQIGVTTSFGLGVKRASSMIKELPANSSITTFVMSDQMELVTENEKDRFLAAGKIEAIRGSLGNLPIAYGLESIAKYLADNPEKTKNAEVYVFSDFQAHTWKRETNDKKTPAQAMVDINKYTKDVFFVDVGGEKTMNIVVSSLLPNEWVLTVGSSVKFIANVKIVGTDIKSLKKGTLAFIINGEKKDLKEFDGSKADYTFEFDFTFAYKGEYLIEVLAEGDEHAIDNQRLYLCNIPEDHQVLILDETAGAGPMEISRKLQLAIAPPNLPGQPKYSRFSTKVVNPNNLNYESLSNYSAIFVSGFSGMNEPISKKLENYVRDGGAVCFFVGPNISSYEYNNFLYKEGKGLLPRKLDKKKSSSGGDSFPIFKGNDHPANVELSAQYKESKNEGNKDVSFNEFYDFANDQNATDSILKLANGGQAILEKTLGKGRCILVNSTIGLEWTTMPFTVEYPIMMQELLRFIIGNPDKAVNLTTGDTLIQNVYVTNQHLLLKTPNGKKIRLTPQEGEDKNTLKVRFDRTNQQGLYVFDVMDGVLKRPRFVVNADAAEGDLERYSESNVKSTFSGSNYMIIPSTISLEDFVSKLNSVTEMAMPILWMIAAAILVESFLAAKFGRRRRGAPQK